MPEAQVDEVPANLPANVTIVPNFQLEDVEKAVFARDYEKASHEILMMLRKMKVGGQFIGYNPHPDLQRVLYTRLAAAIITMLADPNYSLSQEGFDHFASEHAIMDTVFRISYFETSDHMLPMISKNPSEQDKAKLQVAEGGSLIKFLLTYSLRSAFGLNFEETFKKNPQVMFSLWAGMISPLLTVAVQAHERREQLIGLWKIFEGVDIPDGVLPTLSDSYMYASYAVRKDKHDIKGMVHRSFERMMLARGVKVPDATLMLRRRKERSRWTHATKPVILICLEWFNHLHAMFRCYAPIIRQLRTRYHLVAMSRAHDIDELGKAEFDEWHEVPPENLVLGDLVKKIVGEIRPDIIYYPSLGMAMWWVVMASIRLAPIQVMTLGHPASSRSKHMDYVICERGSIGDMELFTEKVVEIPVASARFVMRSDAGGIPFDIPMESMPAVIRVAVPAMLCKLNAPFMHTLREIAQTPRARSVKVEFHFFINMIGANFMQAKREIVDWIPTAVVHPRADYSGYMMELRRCHVHLCTFPFGGTNSNIDSMLLGIPVLAMEGDQPHERFDAVLVRRAGLPEFLVAKSTAGYIETANRLIDDDELRSQLSGKLRRADLQGLFYGEPEEDRRTAFLDAMTLIYEKHEELQMSPDRVFHVGPV